MFLISPCYEFNEELCLHSLVAHVSPLSQVTVPVAGRGDEDILVVRVSHGRGEGETVDSRRIHRMNVEKIALTKLEMGIVRKFQI